MDADPVAEILNGSFDFNSALEMLLCRYCYSVHIHADFGPASVPLKTLRLIGGIRDIIGLLPDTSNRGLLYALEMQGAFFPPRTSNGMAWIAIWLAIPVCIMVRASRMCRDAGRHRYRGKHSQHSWRMGNPQIYVSGKRTMRWEINWKPSRICLDWRTLRSCSLVRMHAWLVTWP